MCGITGILQLDPGPTDELAPTVEAMTVALAHRGPDDQGTWVDSEAGIALGNRRLAVVDLSPGGHQPMLSGNGRHVLAFNGEIYNAAELRRYLEAKAVRFRGTSDTEVLAEAISRWGLDGALRRANAMFALAVWDRADQVLSLARDRLGEKPLYHGRAGGALLFGSELRALRAHRAMRPGVDRDAVALYLRHGCVPAPRSIYEGVSKLPAGAVLEVRTEPSTGRRAVGEPRRWWSAREAAAASLANRLDATADEAADELHDLLTDSVRLRMVADVPLGAFLSGGIDSTTVVALMQAQSASPVRTFTIGLPEAAYDEAAPARAVARHLGTDHTELYVTAAEAMTAVGRLPAVYDEPFGNSSALPTLLVSELARAHVTVAVSGDGGDEVFGGYTRHVNLPALWPGIERLPRPIRAPLAAGLRSVPPARWDRVVGALDPMLPRRARTSHPGDKAHKLARLLGAPDAAAAYLALISDWPDPARLVPGAVEPPTPMGDPASWTGPGDLTDRVMLLDATGYLPDDQLTKLDRASMSVGLEARSPLLDFRLFEFAWRLPRSLKIRHGQGKWLLRRVLARYVGPELTERPKIGFAVPVAEWLRGPMRSWAEQLLTEAVRCHNLVDPGPVHEAWAEHQSGRLDRSQALWQILMLHTWLDAYHPAGQPRTAWSASGSVGATASRRRHRA